MNRLFAQAVGAGIFTVAAIVFTWLFFGPIDGFHHMLKCGILCPIFLDGESPDPGGLMWGGYEVHMSLIRIVLSVILWVLCLYAAWRFARMLRRPRVD